MMSQNFEMKIYYDFSLELVSKELNHCGVIAGFSGRLGVKVVDLCYFALFEDFSLKKIFTS